MSNEHVWTVNFDGGASPNPGIASCAFKIQNETGFQYTKGWRMDGIHTSNEAEWDAVSRGIEEVIQRDKEAEVIKVIGDSQLVIYQIQGIYRVKQPRLRQYYDRINKVKEMGVEIIPSHIEREFNEEMDKACREAR